MDDSVLGGGGRWPESISCNSSSGHSSSSSSWRVAAATSILSLSQVVRPCRLERGREREPQRERGRESLREGEREREPQRERKIRRGVHAGERLAAEEEGDGALAPQESAEIQQLKREGGSRHYRTEFGVRGLACESVCEVWVGGRRCRCKCG
jgi:hypothetical protein